ncbi:fatty acid metabolism transcriptional regulator FadR [Echinimonas agarilytica]|uniref:Fatty acid metabolism regulator protein n=1 Tax=Echinimonas agarilytica TaxID=1215918 RepID=A0AA41W7S4_9GAMM|nr:fatty acid metabolism transcriptional regulator FadR [Echinimonas agarilytica]
MDDQSVIQAKNPAEFAEEYIVRSIWNNRFPPGSILPAERELSELIGVTRTTLREVLQRLKQDGWITIQHGKPTRVNNFWETSGLNILMTLARLDQDGMPDLIDHLLSARTNIAAIYLRAAIKADPQAVMKAIEDAKQTAEDGEEFALVDYNFHQAMARIADNPIYVLILNGFKGLYTRIGGHHYSYPDSRELTLKFYDQVNTLAEQGKHDDVVFAVRHYGRDSAILWEMHRKELPSNIVDK